MTAFIFGVMLFTLLLGYPMFFPLLLAAAATLWLFYGDLPGFVLVQQFVGGITPAALVAVCMFIFAANIMARGQAADRLLRLVLAFVQHRRGGLAIASALACTLFGAVSGSTQATVVAIGGPIRPKMLRAGYPEPFTNALLINASDIALLIPPSIGMIVYGVVSGTSIGELFIAGIGPGLLILLCFCLYCLVAARRFKIPSVPRQRWGVRTARLWEALFPLGFSVIIIGGIYGGYVSPTEAAAISVLYAGLLEVVIYRELSLRDLVEIAKGTGVMTAVVFTLVGAGAAFSWMISFADLPRVLVQEYLHLGPRSGHITILLTISVVFFVGCMFVDPIVVILILTPIFHPIAVSAGIDPVLVGTLVTLQVAIGSATPPFGCDIFTAIAVFGRPYGAIVRGTPPFLLILVGISALLIAFPQVALLLRDVAFVAR